MLTLNLVSTEQKKETKLRHIYGLIKTANLTLMIMVIVAAVILLAAKIVLQAKFNDVVEQTTLVTKTNQGYNNKVREINSQLNFVEKIQNDFIAWSDLLKNLTETVPGDVKFYYVKMNSQDQTVKIKGRAGLRSGLLSFKDKMEAAPYFKNIEFPIKNILEKENVDFEISAQLNLPKR
ncbi:MAG: hypothetical protein PHS62_01140 [Patescibacteria group bacterium]|nr:hypothetical protein [Patescibacteria group bacterium]